MNVIFKNTFLFMREGPHPLAIHLGMAASNMVGMQMYVAQPRSLLSEVSAVKMMRGIQLYQNHSFKQPLLETKEVWRSGGVSILEPVMQGGHKLKSAAPLLIIPSLINKSNILDISEEHSVLRWLQKNGVAAYLLDWGDFSLPDECTMSMDDVLLSKLCPAIECMVQMHGGAIDVLGHCIGGTLALAAASLSPDHIRRLILLSAPWDFQNDAFELAKNVRIWSQFATPEISEKGHLSKYWVQALFASLDAQGSSQKFIDFSEMDQNSEQAKHFVRVEDWLNDGPDIPAAVAKTCVEDWFGRNAPMKGLWKVGEYDVDLSLIQSDVLIVASKIDKLVPYACAIAAKDCLTNTNVDCIDAGRGHIGLIVGRQAFYRVWEPILDYLIAAQK